MDLTSRRFALHPQPSASERTKERTTLILSLSRPTCLRGSGSPPAADAARASGLSQQENRPPFSIIVFPRTSCRAQQRSGFPSSDSQNGSRPKQKGGLGLSDVNVGLSKTPRDRVRRICSADPERQISFWDFKNQSGVFVADWLRCEESVCSGG